MLLREDYPLYYEIISQYNLGTVSVQLLLLGVTNFKELVFSLESNNFKKNLQDDVGVITSSRASENSSTSSYNACSTHRIQRAIRQSNSLSSVPFERKGKCAVIPAHYVLASTCSILMSGCGSVGSQDDLFLGVIPPFDAARYSPTSNILRNHHPSY